MSENGPTEAHNVIQYMALWLGRYDPAFSMELTGVPLDKAIPKINERYGTDFSTETITPAWFLFDFAVAIHKYNIVQQAVEPSGSTPPAS